MKRLKAPTDHKSLLSPTDSSGPRDTITYTFDQLNRLTSGGLDDKSEKNLASKETDIRMTHSH